MSITFPYDNSATVSTTEYSLTNNSTVIATVTTKCRMQAVVDLSNMAAGDSYLLKIREKATSGGTQRILWQATLTGPQSELYALPETIVGNGWDVTAIKLAGTDRSLSWSVRVDDALSMNVTQWNGSTPANLTANGYLQTVLLRWLTDNAAGTPSALSSNLVQAASAGFGAGSITASTFAANALGAVWDELVSAHVTASTIGKLLSDNVNATISSRAQPSDIPSAATVGGAVWDIATSGHTTAGTFGANVDAKISTRAQPSDVPSSATNASAVWNEATSGHTTAGTYGKLVNDDLDAKVSTRAQPSDIPSAATIANTILASTLDVNAPANAQTLKQIINLCAAALYGPVTDSSGAYVARDPGNTKNRIVGTDSTTGRTLTSADGT